jgi:hypothetical protein
MTSDQRHIGRWLVASALACALALAACADFSRGEPSPTSAADASAQPDGGGGDGATGDGAATLSFAAAVYPLLVPTCQGCHSAGNEAGDTQLLFAGDAAADHATVVMFVDTSAPASSRLLTKATGNGHQGGAVYAAGSAEYNTILQWIQQGAQP